LKIEQAAISRRLKPLKFPLRDTPHLTIETNRTCNLRCRACYTLDKGTIKEPAEVKKEIELGLRKRNLETITLLGGEPTLYPHLAEIVSYIKSKNLKCQLLTNGQRFLDADGDDLLARLAAAGIDRVILHVDSGQADDRGDIEAVRKRLFTKLEKARVHFSLSVTIYKEDSGVLPHFLKKYAGFRFFDGGLAVLQRNPATPELTTPDMADEYRSFRKSLGIEPAAYIPSNRDDRTIGWLIYLYYLDARTGKAFAVSPSLYKFSRRIHRIFAGRRPFANIQPPGRQKWLFLFAAALECLARPARIRDLGRFLGQSAGIVSPTSLRFHFVAIQTPPHFDAKKNGYEFCYHCPDATIRNGKLTPVCIADLVNPLPGYCSSAVDTILYKDVYGHLQEI
jgi:hypothetical protein